ncbi:MAG TPA: nitroreductase family protein [Anaerolineales bacterium]|nr:nitroreductase family protein [Anaerolineales bacterium]
MDVTDLLPVIQQRRSVRRYATEPVQNELLETLLQAAVWAPSAHNRQPWRFAVLQSDAQKECLADAMGDRFRADRLAAGDPPEAVAQDMERSRQVLTQAPALLLCCMSMADMDRYPDARRAQAERTMAIQSVALAAQNLLLVAHAAGLGACWRCAPLFCPDTVRETLQLPADWEPQAIISIGYAAEAGRPPERRPLTEVVQWI